ncbi:syntaxin-8 isoform X4 [Arvicanthis niloticus]|uniref:syntaxin-8 isoform X4 n=1 Tax=Arvicanthis niloticus TaxID=61156 RepID=UPI00402B4FBA
MSRAGRRSQLLRAGSVPAAGGDCTMAPDPWFSTYDSTCQIAQEIAEKIQERNQCERRGEKTPKLTLTIRTLLKNLKVKIDLLKDLLLRAVSTRQITQLEGDRRQNLLDDLVTRERLLLASFKNEGAEPDLIRSSLMSKEAKRGTPNPWLCEEPEETRGLGFDEIRQQQQKIIQEIIDDLANLVENTDEKLRTEARRVTLVDRKSTSCETSWWPGLCSSLPAP